MIKKLMATFASGALMLTLLTPLTSLLGGNSVSTNTTANVAKTNGNTTTSVNNQTGINVLGNSVQTSTGVSAQLGL